MKLNQVIAIEKTVRSEHQSRLTNIHRMSSHPELFSGFVKRYEPKDEEGERYPDERQVVRARCEDNLREAFESFVGMINTVATKDIGNCSALADVQVGAPSFVLMQSIPATHLLFWEKALVDLRTFVQSLPELDPSEEWATDGDSGLSKTGEIKTQRTAKEQKPIVLYDATPEHPAQTQMITQDVVVGYWNTVKLSGAISAVRKKEILARLSNVQKAVKTAREEANAVDVEKAKVAKEVFDYILS
jgi:hypothetical protein